MRWPEIMLDIHLNIFNPSNVKIVLDYIYLDIQGDGKNLGYVERVTDKNNAEAVKAMTIYPDQSRDFKVTAKFNMLSLLGNIAGGLIALAQSGDPKALKQILPKEIVLKGYVKAERLRAPVEMKIPINIGGGQPAPPAQVPPESVSGLNPFEL
jgi:hypothetical protein